MPTGAITEYINVAQLVLYVFWIFFFFLILYLHRENKREGYPLESDEGRRVVVQGFPAMPPPKHYALPHGGTATVSDGRADRREVKAEPIGPWPGAPLEPTGDPMRDGVGPASAAPREDAPDLTVDGHPKVIPMRLAEGFSPDPNDPDPRGMDVVAADGNVAGTVKDLWVDLAEPRILYYEVSLSSDGDEGGTTNPLLPAGFARVRFGQGQIHVASILADQFRHVPRTASPDQITRLEEDRVTAYFSAGHLYAKPSRQEPLI